MALVNRKLGASRNAYRTGGSFPHTATDHRSEATEARSTRRTVQLWVLTRRPPTAQLSQRPR